MRAKRARSFHLAPLCAIIHPFLYFVQYLPKILRFLALGVALALGQPPIPTGAHPARQGLFCPPPDLRLGIADVWRDPWAGAEMGVGWTTVPFRWDAVQPFGPTEWNAPISEADISLLRACGQQIVGILTGAPRWATDPQTGLPQGLGLPPDDPRNLWATFVRTAARRHAGHVDGWMVWDRPDDPKAWPGTAADYYRLLEVSYQVIRSEDPDSLVLTGGFAHWPAALRGEPLFIQSLLQEGRGFHPFDVLALHISSPPESLYDLPILYRRLLNQSGLEKPLWVLATVPEDDGNSAPASFLIQAAALALAGGVERVAFSVPADSLKNADIRQTMRAYPVAALYLAGFRTARWDRRDTVSVVTVDRGAQRTTVAWSRSPEEQMVMVPALTTRALLVWPSGETRIVHPDRGYYSLVLPGCGEASCDGGTPLMLVEENPAGTRPMSPAVSQPATALPPTPTPTVQPTPTPIPAATATPTPFLTPPLPASSPTPFPTALAADFPSPMIPEPLALLLAVAVFLVLSIVGLAVENGQRPPTKVVRR